MRHGGALRRHRAQPDVVEAPVEAHGGAHTRARHVTVQDLEQRVEVQCADRPLHARDEPRDDRERAAPIRTGRRDAPVRGGPMDDAIDGDQLTVERIERAQPQVAATRELGDRHVTLVGPVQQRLQRRGLEHGAGPRRGMNGVDQRRVEHGRSIRREVRLTPGVPRSREERAGAAASHVG